MALTHLELVARSARWLASTRRCGVVCTEWSAPHVRDMPDAIGWVDASSCIVIECKTSMSDYYSDSRKTIHKRPFGTERWYACEPDVIPVDKVREGWGLLYIHSKQARRKVDAPVHTLTIPALTRQSQYLFNAVSRLWYIVNPSSHNYMLGFDRVHICPLLLSLIEENHEADSD